MALWSKNSDWGQSERTVTMRSLVASLVLVLFVGCLIGYSIRGSAQGGNAKKLQAKQFQQSDVVVTDISAIDAAPKTSQGAVQAVTSFITGQPQISLETPQQEQSVLNDIIAPTADPSVRADIQNAIDTARNALIGTGSFQKPLTTKILTTPASYRVDMLAPDRARVQVWYMSLEVDSSTQTAQAGWFTNDIQVVWTNHWRIATFSGTAGPTPAVSASNTDNTNGDPYAQVVQNINGFMAFRPALSEPTS